MVFSGDTFQQFFKAAVVVAGLTGCNNVALQPIPVLPKTKVVSLKVNHCVDLGKTVKSVYARNLSSIMGATSWKSDFDRDGLSDEAEFPKAIVDQFNISFRRADTNSDGYSDFVVMKLGQTVSAQAMLRPCMNIGVDTDSDGLSDCEEAMLKTEYQNPDSDKDGIVDTVEMLIGLNPRDYADAFQDMDQDNLSNFQELQMNTAIDVSNTVQMETMALRYKSEYYQDTQNRDCATYLVKNIPVMGTTNGNLVKFWVMESDSSDLLTTKFVSILFSEKIVPDTRIVVDQVTNQTIDGVSIPLVTEPGE